MAKRTRTSQPRRLRRRPVVAGALALTLVATGGTAWALDRFVIEHVEISDVAAYEAALAATSGTTTDSSSTTTDAGTTTSGTVVTGTTSVSDTATVTISTVTTGSGDSTVTYYVADVVLTIATALRSAFAQNQFGLNITEDTSDIAEDNDAIFAING
ncbi:MAG: phosphodiester glycosidase family protein, partial [Cellulomonadaceae bacterium]|nr:phosphodiester glycosidase family protein [Cellulomonadaceae bacterium]